VVLAVAVCYLGHPKNLLIDWLNLGGHFDQPLICSNFQQRIYRRRSRLPPLAIERLELIADWFSHCERDIVKSNTESIEYSVTSSWRNGSEGRIVGGRVRSMDEQIQPSWRWLIKERQLSWRKPENDRTRPKWYIRHYRWHLENACRSVGWQ